MREVPSAAMRIGDRFAEAVAGPADETRLDVAAFCIAAAAHSGFDVDDGCARLDELSQGCPNATFEGLRLYLFETLRFAGNSTDYGDPENSFLDAVVERRTGIPITLAVVMMEVGRRVGVEVRGIGMPGHFLVQDARRDDEWCDPFARGAVYDLEDCRVLFRGLHGPNAHLMPQHLAQADARAIVARILNNLEHGRLAADPLQLAWMCDLHLRLPDLPPAERQRLQNALRSVRSRWN